jgi:CHASE2 domain-containing sensor protein
MSNEREQARKGRHAALVIAITAVAWVLVGLIGAQYGWSWRTLLFFDLAALAGFVFAFWIIFQIWRMRRDNRG